MINRQSGWRACVRACVRVRMRACVPASTRAGLGNWKENKRDIPCYSKFESGAYYHAPSLELLLERTLV